MLFKLVKINDELDLLNAFALTREGVGKATAVFP